MAALLIHGLQPGPFVFSDNPYFVANVYSSLFLGVLFTLILGILLIKIIGKLHKSLWNNEDIVRFSI